MAPEGEQLCLITKRTNIIVADDNTCTVKIHILFRQILFFDFLNLFIMMRVLCKSELEARDSLPTSHSSLPDPSPISLSRLPVTACP